MLIKKGQIVRFKEGTPDFYSQWSLSYSEEEIESMVEDDFIIVDVPTGIISDSSEFLLKSGVFEGLFPLQDFSLIKEPEEIIRQTPLFI